MGVTFARFLEVSTATGLYIGAAIVFAYAVLGGMKGITYTQVAQYIVLIIAYTIPALFISLQLTGNILPQLGLIGNYAPSGGDVAFLAKLDQVVTELGFKAYTAESTNMFNMFLFTMSLMIGTAGLPHVIIRFFTVPKVADARSSAGWALVFIALLYTVAPAVGSMARLNLTTTMWPSAITGNALDGEAVSRADIDSKPELAWVKTWEKTGLLKMVDLNGDGKIQYFNTRQAADRRQHGRDRGRCRPQGVPLRMPTRRRSRQPLQKRSPRATRCCPKRCWAASRLSNVASSGTSLPP